MDIALDLAEVILASARARAQLNSELSALGSSVRIVDGIAGHLIPGVPPPTAHAARPRILMEKCPDNQCSKHHVIGMNVKLTTVENFDEAPWSSD